MAETPYFFSVSGSPRFAVFHAPPKPTRGAMLFCHPLFEEKLWTHRVYVTLARKMARMGYAVLRMDLRGNGDSDGDFATAGVDDYMEDLEGGWYELKRHTGEPGVFGLFGLRLGGTLALEFSQHHPDVEAILLWDPILDTERYLQELLRLNLSGQMATHGRVQIDRDGLIKLMCAGEPVSIEGYPLAEKLFASLRALNVSECRAPPAKHSLLVQISRSISQPLRREYALCAEQWSGLMTDTAVAEPFWREIKTFYSSAPTLEAVSLPWLESLR